MSFEPLPPDTASYKVKHYRENADGTYSLYQETSHSGTVGANAGYTPRIYTNYTYKQDKTKVNGILQTSGRILAGSTTVVELYYERNTVTLRFKLAGGKIGGNTADVEKKGKWGTAFSALSDPVREGYAFIRMGYRTVFASDLSCRQHDIHGSMG